MKKICIYFSILLLIFSTQVLAYEDYDTGNRKRKEAGENALVEFLEKYKTEEVSEEERIIDYTNCGASYDFTKEGENIIGINVSFTVTPYLEGNSIWKKDFINICFMEFSIENDEYVLQKISLKPEKYDKFLERFEQYKQNGNVEKTTVEIETVQGEKNENLKSSRIEEMSNTIFTTSAALLLIVILSVVLKMVLKRMKK